MRYTVYVVDDNGTPIYDEGADTISAAKRAWKAMEDTYGEAYEVCIYDGDAMILSNRSDA